MAEISVFVQNKNNNNFINNLFNDINHEIISSADDYKVVLNASDESIDEIYDVLVRNIFEEFSKKILIKVININCSCFTKEDKYEIWKKSFENIITDMMVNSYEHKNRIHLIEKKLKEFCENSNSFCVDGFVNFRLKELEEDFEDVVEECIREYLLENEYNEFINMIKYFVSVQSPLFLSVEVFYGDNIVVIGDGKNITERCINEFKSEFDNVLNDRDDFLLNSLISIAPKRIVIIQKNNYLNEEFKKTLLGIFGDKLKIKTE